MDHKFTELIGQWLKTPASERDYSVGALYLLKLSGVTSPSSTKSLCFAKNRRHKDRNFAAMISARLGELLGIPFIEDLAECHSKHRVGAVFTFGKEPHKQRNLIVFDDFVTSGATMISMKNLLEPLGYNLVFFTGINNKI